VVRPLGQGPFDLRVRYRHDPLGPRRQAHEAGSPVAGIGHSLEITVCLELFDEEAGTLLGDPGLFGQVGDSGAVGADAGRDPGLSKGDVGDAGGDDGIMCPLLKRSVRDEQQDAEVRILTLRGHGARLDK
jgi:hypothetical protein